jgi:hypothetical protein
MLHAHKADVVVSVGGWSVQLHKNKTPQTTEVWQKMPALARGGELNLVLNDW